MKTLRTGRSLLDRKRSTESREECKTEDIVRWIRSRRRAWNQHVTRITGQDSQKL
jgi:hypothetical protein